MPMKSEPDFDYIYPVIDCPICGKEDVPVGELGFIDDGSLKMLRYCLNCHQPLNEMPTPKGYASILELEEEGWNTEL